MQELSGLNLKDGATARRIASEWVEEVYVPVEVHLFLEKSKRVSRFGLSYCSEDHRPTDLKLVALLEG